MCLFVEMSMMYIYVSIHINIFLYISICICILYLYGCWDIIISEMCFIYVLWFYYSCN